MASGIRSVTPRAAGSVHDAIRPRWLVVRGLHLPLLWWGLTVLSAAGQDTADLARRPPFDGVSLAGWMTTAGRPVGDAWEIVDGVIHLTRHGRRGDHILSVEEFGDFDFSFEWRISPGGNNGIKYRVRDHDGRWLGCEYQMVDDQATRLAGKPADAKHLTGALYDLYEPSPAKVVRPAGDYNTGRIVVRGDHVEHWLNGALMLSATVGDAEWERRIRASKFADTPDFARQGKGRLMLTAYDGEAWFRNARFVTD